MGRTLHYKIKDCQKISKKDADSIRSVMDEFNEKYEWTCENMWLEFEKWNDIYKGYGAFTKVAGNEWNAFLVTSAITLMSIKCPTLTFTLSDEGEFLLFPLEIKNGKARVDLKRWKESISYWQEMVLEYKLKNNEKQAKYFENLISEEVEKLSSVSAGSKVDSTGEIITGNSNTFKDVSIFCRTVNQEDFDEYPEFKTCFIEVNDEKVSIEGNTSQLMAGFEGEYYGKVSEAEVAMNNNKMKENIINIVDFLDKNGMLKDNK